MSTFIRGPVCGVSNCPSRLWRIIDGRRTCQYGHVMEGDVEFNNDDDDVAGAGVITRRLNLTTGATGSFQSSFSASQSQNYQKTTGNKKVEGYEAKILFIKCFQFVLRSQTMWLIREKSFPPEFEQVVKLIWIQYLKWLDASDRGNGNEDNEAPENRLESTTLQLNMPAAVSVLYMASVHMGLPVYTTDYIKWIAEAKLLYYRANSVLPEQWREKLPNSYLRLLDGGKPPKDGHLLLKVSQVCYRTKFTKNFNSKVRYEGLVLKLVLFATLPPEFYFFTVELIRKVDQEDNFKLVEHPKAFFSKFYLWPEVRIMAYFLLTVRWVLLSDRETYPLRWILSLSEQSRRPDDSIATDLDDLLTRISSSKDDVNVLEWSQNQTSAYLNWFEKSFLPTQPEDANMKLDHRIAQRKLHKIFPIKSEPFATNTAKTRASFVDQLQENYLHFLSDVESHWNDQLTSDANERAIAIAKLEHALTIHLENRFALSTQQIASAMRYLSSTTQHQ